jgi:agmatine deiminase
MITIFILNYCLTLIIYGRLIICPFKLAITNSSQFVYNPDYLRKSDKWSKTISDVDAICKTINITSIKSNIILDGGNVISTTDKVIMCDKIFSENPHIIERDLIKELQICLR